MINSCPLCKEVLLSTIGIGSNPDELFLECDTLNCSLIGEDNCTFCATFNSELGEITEYLINIGVDSVIYFLSSIRSFSNDEGFTELSSWHSIELTGEEWWNEEKSLSSMDLSNSAIVEVSKFFEPQSDPEYYRNLIRKLLKVKAFS